MFHVETSLACCLILVLSQLRAAQLPSGLGVGGGSVGDGMSHQANWHQCHSLTHAAEWRCVRVRKLINNRSDRPP